MPGKEIIACGRVQGVGFRWFVRDCARQNGIRGYVKNLADGTVFIAADGDPLKLERFIEEVRKGNRIALVTELKISELQRSIEYEDFCIA